MVVDDNNSNFLNRPVTLNSKNNLLEIEEHMYILDDVEKPNVFRNMFPYSEVPKIPFNDRIVPHNMPKDIWITDTTFRDGQQSRTPYTTDQIVTLYNLAPLGLYDIDYNFGDITYSYEEDKASWKQYVIQGWVPAWKYFVKFEGMSEEEAKALVAEAQSAKKGLFEE